MKSKSLKRAIALASALITMSTCGVATVAGMVANAADTISATDTGTSLEEVKTFTNRVRWYEASNSGVNAVSFPIKYTLYDENMNPIDDIVFSNTYEMMNDSVVWEITYTEEDKGRVWTILPEYTDYMFASGVKFVVGEGVCTNAVKYELGDVYLHLPERKNETGDSKTPIRSAFKGNIVFEGKVPESLLDKVFYDVYTIESGNSHVGDLSYNHLMATLSARDIVNSKGFGIPLSVNTNVNRTVQIVPRTIEYVDAKAISKNISSVYDAKDDIKVVMTIPSPVWVDTCVPRFKFPECTYVEEKVLRDSGVSYEVLDENGNPVAEFDVADILDDKAFCTVKGSNEGEWTFVAKDKDGNVIDEVKMDAPHTNGSVELPIPTIELDYTPVEYEGAKPGDVIVVKDSDGSDYSSSVADDDGKTVVNIPDKSDVCVENTTSGAVTHVNGETITPEDKITEEDITKANQYVVLAPDKETIIKNGKVVDGELKGMITAEEMKKLGYGYVWVRLQYYDPASRTTKVLSEYRTFIDADSDTGTLGYNTSTSARGDVNLDGVFNIADCVFVEKYLLGEEALESKSQFIMADVIVDASVDIFDYCELRGMLVEQMKDSKK